MKAKPTHFVSGLQGGYIPNVVEHYDTKTSALVVLAEWASVVRDDYWDEPQNGPVGDVRRDGFIEYRLGVFDTESGTPPSALIFYDYAMIESCDDPATCEMAQEGWEE